MQKLAWPTLLILPVTALPVVHAPAEPAVVVSPILSTGVTASGQPIVLPKGDVRVIVSTYAIAPGADLPEHKHPFARYAYVLAGTLRVQNGETGRSETYQSGDFVVEAIDQWHSARNVGADVVRLIVIDQVEGDRANTVIRSATAGPGVSGTQDK